MKLCLSAFCCQYAFLKWTFIKERSLNLSNDLRMSMLINASQYQDRLSHLNKIGSIQWSIYITPHRPYVTPLGWDHLVHTTRYIRVSMSNHISSCVHYQHTSITYPKPFQGQRTLKHPPCVYAFTLPKGALIKGCSNGERVDDDPDT